MNLMGTTNRTYRNHLDNFIEKFKPFEKALRQENKQYMHLMWEKAHSFGHAGSAMASTSPGIPAMISVMLGMQKEIHDNQEKIQRLEEKLEDVQS